MTVDDGSHDDRRAPGARLDRSGVRGADVVSAVAAVVLLVLLFALKWYGPGMITSGREVTSTVNGWDGLTHLHWLILVTILAALAMVIIRATGRAPALPRAVSLVVPLLGLVTLLWLGYRVLISIPPGEKPAAYVGLVCVLAIVIGAGASLREEWTSS